MLHKWKHQLRAALQPLQATNKRSKLLYCLVTSNPCHTTTLNFLSFTSQDHQCSLLELTKYKSGPSSPF